MSLVDMTGWVMKEHNIKDSLLTIIKRDNTRKDGKHSYWIVKCECGTIFSARGDAIRNGTTTSCGCLTHKKKQQQNIIDMTGWIMSEHGVPDSRLTVIKLVDINQYINNHSGAEWFVKCDCGKIFIVRADQIRSGEVKSCGCLQKEKSHERKIDMTNWIMKEHGVKDSLITVICFDHNDENNNSYWKIKCTCGKEKVARGAEIRNGTIKSCGCKRFLQVGNKYNKLTIIEPYNSVTHKYKCRCDCGTIIDVTARDLTSNNTKSCGCLYSAGEYFIKNILQSNNISFIHNQEYFKDLVNENNNILRYDFIIFKDNQPVRIIEFDGPQHQTPSNLFGEQEFIRLQKSDKIKNKYALSHNIPLIRIPYTELNNLSYELLFSNKYLIKGEKL